MIAHQSSLMVLAGAVMIGGATGLTQARYADKANADALTTQDAQANAIGSVREVRIGKSGAAVRMWRDPITGQAMYSATTDGVHFSRDLPISNVIRLRFGNFDPRNALNAEPPVADALRSDGNMGAGPRSMIVQFIVPPLPAMLNELRACGATTLAYLPDSCFIVHMDDAAMLAASALPEVRWIGEYHPAYRLEEPLGAVLADGVGAGLGTQKYSIQLLERGPAAQQVVADQINALGGAVNLTIPQGFRIEATLSPAQLLAVARMNEVLFIDRKGEPGVDMDIARQVTGAVPTLSTLGFTGQGVRGEVMDGGVRTTHQAFQGPGILLHNIGTNTDTSHGTSTTGIVFGNGAANAAGTGMLPNREQAIVSSYLAVTNRYIHTSELVDPAGPYRAVFQSNSWGDALTTSYTTISSDMDDIIFDFDILICQSQSNNNNQLSRPQAWAKNILSVGGIDHVNTFSRTDDNTSTASFGPAADGRVKPDLMHFYDSILCTSSTSDTSYTTSFGGTSGATPITAGAFGLLFQMWHQQVFPGRGGAASVFLSRPHATTAKAMMINTAYKYSIATINRARQGWGMPDLAKLYGDRNNLFIVNEEDAITPLGVQTYLIDVPAGQAEFRATMTYRDPAGNTSATVHRINDLSLKVTSPGNTVYWGNNGLSAANVSSSGGVSNTVDTVENVFLQNPAAGTWTVQVYGDTIVQDSNVATPAIDATFALVVTGTEHAPQVYGDITGDGLVNVADLLTVITNWGACPALPATCPSDIAPTPTGDGQVNVSDLLAVITNWS